jgi:hypothetical protein
MSNGQRGQQTPRSLCLHPSVGTSVSPMGLDPRQKVAAVAKVRCLEHDLLEGDRVSRLLSRDAAEAIVSEINSLRRALGWLEIDVNGQWRWPHDHEPEAANGRRPQLTAVGGGASARTSESI